MAPQYVIEQAGFHKLPSSIKTSALVLWMTESIMVSSVSYNIERMFDSSYN